MFANTSTNTYYVMCTYAKLRHVTYNNDVVVVTIVVVVVVVVIQ